MCLKSESRFFCKPILPLRNTRVLWLDKGGKRTLGGRRADAICFSSREGHHHSFGLVGVNIRAAFNCPCACLGGSTLQLTVVEGPPQSTPPIMLLGSTDCPALPDGMQVTDVKTLLP